MPPPLLGHERPQADTDDEALVLSASLRNAGRFSETVGHQPPLEPLTTKNSVSLSEEQKRALLELLLGNLDPDGAYSAAQNPAGVEVDLDYTDSWPTVEVSVGINEVLRVDVQDLTFDADFVVFLDWLDPKLRRGEHYTYNAEHGKFELMRTLRECKDELQFFNPSITILNSKQEAEETDHLPQIFEEVLRDGNDVPWLTKKFHFVGTLSCRGVNARYFPFDIEDLVIRIASPEMTGVTSLGQDRKVQLIEPVLRRQWQCKQVKDTTWVEVSWSEDGMSHMWGRADVNDYNGLGVGEMKVIGFGGVSLPEGQEYNVHIVCCRQWYPRYVFDFLILNIQAIAAVASLYVPFSVDMLANRMSITLTVMLTLVSSASARPPAIESLPYSTVHDTYAQFTLFCVAVVGVGNLLVFQNCWSMYREEGVDDVYDPSLRMVVNKISGGLLGDWVCEKGTCGASNIDCLLFYLSLAFIFVCISVVIVTSQMHRVSTMLRIKHEIDVNDQNPGTYSRLVLVSRVFGFALMKRLDLRATASHVALLPFVGLFMRAWRAVRRMRRFLCSCYGHERKGIFNSLKEEDLLFSAGLPSAKDRAQRKLPQISRFDVKLSPYELFRVLDVGSGELGFYAYWMEEAGGNICSSGTDSKLKYNKSQTFVDQFLRSPSGPEDMAQQIVQRFQLSVTSRPTMRTTSCTPARNGQNMGDYLAEPGSGADMPQDGSPTHATVQCMTPATPEMPLPGAPTMGDREQSVDSLKRGQSGRSGISSPNTMGNTATSFSKRFGAKKKIILCLTGANRQMLRDDADGRALLQAFSNGLNERLEKFGVECIVYSPEDVQEAMYELWATEWVVQHGDLDVDGMGLQKAYRTLQGGREEAPTNLQEVEAEFRDLKADFELRTAYCRAATYTRAASHSRSQSRAQTPREREEGRLPAYVPCSAFYASFEASEPLLRALVRSRLFSGTMSAGSGSSQVTLRCALSLESSQVHSIPLGNRTPLVSMTVTDCPDGSSAFSSKLPKTKTLASMLLLEEGDRRSSGKYAPNETRPAWPEDGPVERSRLDLWRRLIGCCAEERGLPSQQRGLFVGISALFYAAKLAGCAGEILPRDAFLERMRLRRDQLMQDGKGSGRDLANLTLVITMVEFVLHRTAFIVCKRTWRVGEQHAQSDFVATWTLGMYLKHAGLMGGGNGPS